MALQSEVKCGKCDRYYSVLKVRCPHCGARRGSQGKFARDIDNYKGKTIIVAALFGVLIILVVVLLLTSGEDPLPADTSSPPTPPSSLLPDDSTNTSEPGEYPSPTPTPTPSPTPTEEPSPSPTPQPTVTAVEIQYAGRPIANNDFTEQINKSLKLTLKITPADTELVPVWSSSNTSVFDVVPTDTTGKAATVTITGRGDATLTVTVGEITVTCIVRGRT